MKRAIGVKKDLDTARRLYMTAAEQGNAKAMHNLAVLYAEGAAVQAGLPGPRRNGSARPPNTASPTANIISPSSMPAASASTRTWPNPINGSRLQPPRATRKPPRSATMSASGSTRNRCIGASWPSQTFVAAAAAGSRHHGEDAGRRLGRRPQPRPDQAAPNKPRAIARSRSRHREVSVAIFAARSQSFDWRYAISVRLWS